MRRKPLQLLGLSLLTWLVTVNPLQNAIANGDTRTLNLYHAHTHEDIEVTFMRDGSYDRNALKKLNWFLRDWRRDEPTNMDPRLFDIVWMVYRETGTRQPIQVVSAYRSPETNNMLRRRSRGVAKHSQHTQGKAMDFHLPGASMAKVREIGMKLQRGGVGYYPSANSPFVHLDAGSVRHWPRMTRAQLSRLFPDGKTVHLPADGKPMPRYEEALAEIERWGGTAPSSLAALDDGSKRKGFWARLFGGDDEDDEERISAPTRIRQPVQRAPQRTTVVATRETDEEESPRSTVQERPRTAPVLQRAQEELRNPSPPQGQAVAQPEPAPQPPRETAPVVVAAQNTAPIPAPAPLASPLASQGLGIASKPAEPAMVWQKGPDGKATALGQTPLPVGRIVANVPVPEPSPERRVQVASLGTLPTAAIPVNKPIPEPAPFRQSTTASAEATERPSSSPAVKNHIPVPAPKPQGGSQARAEVTQPAQPENHAAARMEESQGPSLTASIAPRFGKGDRLETSSEQARKVVNSYAPDAISSAHQALGTLRAPDHSNIEDLIKNHALSQGTFMQTGPNPSQTGFQKN